MYLPEMPQATQSPYTPAGGNNMPTAPRLGTPVPGTTGGLPQKPGLSVYDNPMAGELHSQPQQSAQHTQSFGRGEDSVLVHMTPNEVNSLRGLAQQFGGDLTTNPHTGLPEAGFLGKLLPTLLGGLGMAFGIPPVWMGALGLAGGTAATGSLSKGLQMGLGAFGGASLAGGLGLGSKLGEVGAGLGLPGAAAKTVAPTLASGAQGVAQGANNAASLAAKAVSAAPVATAPAAAINAGAQGVAQGLGSAANAAGTATSGGGFFSQFGNAAKQGLGSGLVAKAAPMAAASGLMGSVSNALTPTVKPTKEKPSEYGYTGPYSLSEERKSILDPNLTRNEAGVLTTPEGKMTSGEQLYYKPTTSYVDSSGKEWTPGRRLRL